MMSMVRLCCALIPAAKHGYVPFAGGFYDFTVPPHEGVPSPDGIPCRDCGFNFTFDRLGIRIPMVRRHCWVTVVHIGCFAMHITDRYLTVDPQGHRGP